MKIKFEAQNAENIPRGMKHSVIFDASGGCIGSSDACDWVVQNGRGTIPDILVTIRYDGRRFVMDVAGLSVFVNGESRPLPIGRRLVICDGDAVQFDDLSITVRAGAQAHLDHRLLSFETLIEQDSDDLEKLLSQPNRATPNAAKDPDSVDPIALLDETLRPDQGNDPLVLWNTQDDRRIDKANDPLLCVLMAPSETLSKTVPALSNGSFDPVSAPTIRKDNLGFEELVSAQSKALPEELDPVTIERHVATYCSPSDAEFSAQCWERFRDRLMALKTSGEWK